MCVFFVCVCVCELIMEILFAHRNNQDMTSYRHFKTVLQENGVLEVIMESRNQLNLVRVVGVARWSKNGRKWRNNTFVLDVS